MSEQDVTGDPAAEGGAVPRVHPEEPAEGAVEQGRSGEEDDVPRRHAQEPAEGAEQPGEPH